jgi:hypothetical protein
VAVHKAFMVLQKRMAEKNSIVREREKLWIVGTVYIIFFTRPHPSTFFSFEYNTSFLFSHTPSHCHHRQQHHVVEMREREQKKFMQREKMLSEEKPNKPPSPHHTPPQPPSRVFSLSRSRSSSLSHFLIFYFSTHYTFL